MTDKSKKIRRVHVEIQVPYNEDGEISVEMLGNEFRNFKRLKLTCVRDTETHAVFELRGKDISRHGD